MEKVFKALLEKAEEDLMRGGAPYVTLKQLGRSGKGFLIRINKYPLFRRRDDKLRLCSLLLGREVSSTNDIKLYEAVAMVKFLYQQDGGKRDVLDEKVMAWVQEL